MESRSLEKKDGLICFKAFSSSRRAGASTESIPRVFNNFIKGSCVDDSSLRRTRSFSLPRVLRKDKEDKQSFSFSFLFGAKTNHKDTCQPSEKTSVNGNDQESGTKPDISCEGRLNGMKNVAQTIGKSSAEQKQFAIPTICVQTPEEVNLILHLQPVAQTLRQTSGKQLTQNPHTDSKEHNQSPKEDTASPASTTKTTDKENCDRRTKPRRKRSASWGGEFVSVVSCSGDAAGELKNCMSWSAFLNSDTSRETDLCSTEL